MLSHINYRSGPGTAAKTRNLGVPPSIASSSSSSSIGCVPRPNSSTEYPNDYSITSVPAVPAYPSSLAPSSSPMETVSQTEFDAPQSDIATYNRRSRRFGLMPLCSCCRVPHESNRPSTNQFVQSPPAGAHLPPPQSSATQCKDETSIQWLPRPPTVRAAKPVFTDTDKAKGTISKGPFHIAPLPSNGVSAAAQLITQVSDKDVTTVKPSSSITGFLAHPPMPPQQAAHDDIVQRRPLLGPQVGRDRGKKTLVLDLDETLVHSAFKPVPFYAFQINVEIEEQIHEIFVSKRPGVDDFLKQVSVAYEVVVFTASLEKYANPVIDVLDPQGLCSWRLFRESCTQMFIPSQGTVNYVKDLARLGRDLRHVIIVDNSPFAYSFQPENAIPIRSWFDDQGDRELIELIPILAELAKVDDVPQVMRQALPARDDVFSQQELTGTGK